MTHIPTNFHMLEGFILNYISNLKWLHGLIRVALLTIVSQLFLVYYKFRGIYSNPEKKLDRINEKYPLIKDPKVAIVTGGNTGIGYETSRYLAKSGYKVILACRNESKAQKAIEEMKSKATNQCDIEFIKLDLSSFDSVREFVDKFLEKDLPLDLLVNNAGVMSLAKFKQTNDGFEMQYQINYLSPFFMTYLLSSKLKDTPGSKIINLTSFAHYGAEDCDFSLINDKSHYSRTYNYCKSKAAVMMSTFSFQEKLSSSGVQVFAVNPGLVATDLWQHIPGMSYFMKFTTSLLYKTPLQGSLTTLRLALTPNSVLTKKATSRYFSDELPMKCYHPTRDSARQEALWRETCKSLSLDPSL